MFGEIHTRYLDNTNRKMNRTLNPASKPAQILVILDVRQCCFLPVFKHCSITPRRESIPPLSWDIKTKQSQQHEQPLSEFCNNIVRLSDNWKLPEKQILSQRKEASGSPTSCLLSPASRLNLSVTKWKPIQQKW